MLNRKDRFPQRKLRWGERGGIVGFCPNERRLLSQDEIRQMKVPPFREVCNYCGMFVNKNVDSKVFG